MIKLVALLKRKEGMTRQEYVERWLVDHTKLSSQLEGCIEYRINIATAEQPDGAEPLYDGTAELWWENIEAMEASFDAALGKIAGEDADAFCGARVHIYTEEYLVIQGRQARQPVVKLS